MVCTAPGEILVNRFEGCALSAQRHPCHVDVTSLNELPPRLLSERWQALDLPGPVFTVDTSSGQVNVNDLALSIVALAGRS